MDVAAWCVESEGVDSIYGVAAPAENGRAARDSRDLGEARLFLDLSQGADLRVLGPLEESRNPGPLAPEGADLLASPDDEDTTLAFEEARDDGSLLHVRQLDRSVRRVHDRSVSRDEQFSGNRVDQGHASD